MASHLVKVLIGPYQFPKADGSAGGYTYATGREVACSATRFAAIPSGDFTGGSPKLLDVPILSTGGGSGGGGPHTHPESDITSLATDLSTLTAAVSGKEPALPGGGTTAQYIRGDKTLATLNSAAVGLGNVNNTADSAKPVSTAQQTALNTKAASVHTHVTADITDFVAGGGGGDVHPFPISYTTGLQTALNAKTDDTVFQSHVNGLNPHDQYALDTDLQDHISALDAHPADRISLPSPITGQTVSDVYEALVDIYGKLPGGSSAYEQDEPYSFAGTLAVQSGVAKYLADVNTDILHCRAILGTSANRDVSFAVKAEAQDLYTTVGATVRDAQVNHQNSGNSISVNKPATAAGDLVYLFLQSRASDPTLGTPVVPTPPTGFADQNIIAPAANANSSRPRIYMWRKPLVVGEGSGSYTFTGLETNGKYVAIAISFKDQDPFTPVGPSLFNLASVLDVNSAQAATATVGGFTQTFNKGLQVAVVAGNSGGTGDFNLPASLTGWTRVAFDRGGSGYVGMAVYVRNGDTAISTGTVSATDTAATPAAKPVYWLGWSWSLRPNRPCVPVTLDRSQGLYVPKLVLPHLTPQQALSVGIDNAGTTGNEGKDAVLWAKRVPH